MSRKVIQTKKGEVLLVRDETGDFLSSLEMGEGLGIFFHYRYEDAEKTKEVLSSICIREGQMVVCAAYDNFLVGYVAIVRPGEGTRWDDINKALIGSADVLEDPVLLELGSIEVSAAWRSIGLAHELMAFTFEDPRFEHKIVFSREFSWHWDLKSSGLSSYRYRSMLLKLFEKAGFRYCETDDKEIQYSGENMLMTRVGRDVPAGTAFTFYRSIQRSEPRGWGWG